MTAITDERTISGEVNRSEVFPHETKAINTRTEVGRAAAVPIEQQIQQRAYELYEQRGKTDGHELDDWLQAECEIKGTQAKAA